MFHYKLTNNAVYKCMSFSWHLADQCFTIIATYTHHLNYDQVYIVDWILVLHVMIIQDISSMSIITVLFIKS